MPWLLACTKGKFISSIFKKNGIGFGYAFLQAKLILFVLLNTTAVKNNNDIIKTETNDLLQQRFLSWFISMYFLKQVCMGFNIHHAKVPIYHFHPSGSPNYNKAVWHWQTVPIYLLGG